MASSYNINANSSWHSTHISVNKQHIVGGPTTIRINLHSTVATPYIPCVCFTRCMLWVNSPMKGGERVVVGLIC